MTYIYIQVGSPYFHPNSDVVRLRLRTYYSFNLKDQIPLFYLSPAASVTLAARLSVRCTSLLPT
jgi:hypothetical protein